MSSINLTWVFKFYLIFAAETLLAVDLVGDQKITSSKNDLITLYEHYSPTSNQQDTNLLFVAMYIDMKTIMMPLNLKSKFLNDSFGNFQFLVFS